MFSLLFQEFAASLVFQYSSLFKILNLYKINHFIRIKN